MFKLLRRLMTFVPGVLRTLLSQRRKRRPLGPLGPHRNLRAHRRHLRSQQGFALPMALMLGMVMVILGTTTLLQAQSGQMNSFERSQTGSSFLVAEGGLARVLAQLTQSENAVLLTQTYDPINPETGKTYLGQAGKAIYGWPGSDPNNPNPAITYNCTGSENGLPDIEYEGTIGNQGTYYLRAYRYDEANQEGVLLVEGEQGGSSSSISVTLEIESEQFSPGLLVMDELELRGRNVTGLNGHVYYNPAGSANKNLKGTAVPGSPDRANYLAAIKTGVDNITGNITACKLTPNIQANSGPGAAQVAAIKGNRTLSAQAGQKITSYRTPVIDLEDNQVLTIDTTEGRVDLYVDGGFDMEDNSKIRNIRTDGNPPRVGDLRLIMTNSNHIELEENICIENAFIYNPNSHVYLDTDGDGCPSPGNSNIDGVVWAKVFKSSTDTQAGIAVPEDVSSLDDVLEPLNLAPHNHIKAITNWNREYS